MIHFVQGWDPWFQMAAAAAVLICVAGLSLLVVGSGGLRSRMASLEAERRNLEQREEGLRRKLGEEQGRTRSLTAELQKLQGGGNSPLTASLVLLPGLFRAEPVREKLVLPPSAQLARIEIQLEPRDDYYFRFRAELRTQGGEELLIRADLQRRRTATGNIVSFDVPAEALAAGDYELTLKGVSTGRPAEDIGYYYISVNEQ